MNTISEIKKTAKQRSWFLYRLALPLLIALLAFGFVGVSPGAASPPAPRLPATVSSQKADAAPALIAYNGTLYVGWTGRNTAHNLNLMTYSTSGTFGLAQKLTDTTLPGSGPSLAVFNGNLYVAWRGIDNHLNVGRYNPADQTHLANKVTLRDTSSNAPSIAAFGGRLYLSWRGMDGHLNIISSRTPAPLTRKSLTEWLSGQALHWWPPAATCSWAGKI